jgi:cytochrome c-type biogenesis protein CcmH
MRDDCAVFWRAGGPLTVSAALGAASTRFTHGNWLALKKIFRRLAGTLLIASAPLYAQVAPVDLAYADRYHALIKELRCLVCQNESLAESNADLARDLRAEVRQMMKRGATNAQIIDFLVARYGDFVLYRPPFKPITYLLWVAPFVAAILSLLALINIIRRRGREADPPLSPQEQSRLSELLDDHRRD